MHTNFTIEDLMRTEKKMFSAAKFLLILFGCAFLLLVILDKLGFGSAVSPVLSAWFFLGLIIALLLIATGIALVKYAVSFLAFLAHNRKLGADNLFAALIATIFILFIFGMFSMLVLPPSTSRSKARDARRMSDMRTMLQAQEMYRGANGSYFTSESMPTAIGNYLSVIPFDPSTGTAYGSINNNNIPDNFCYFATLENNITTLAECADGCGFYSASPAGNFYLQRAPESLDECVSPGQMISKTSQ
jgi:hypothetical protein